MAISDGGTGGEGPVVRLGMEKLYEAVERLLKSELYYTRLRRVLINGYDPKVLTDFLVMDDLFGVIHRQFFLGWGEQPTPLVKLRAAVFEKALKSAERKEDVRGHPNIRKLAKYLLEFHRQEGTPAEQVFDAVYGKPKKPYRPTPETRGY